MVSDNKKIPVEQRTSFQQQKPSSIMVWAGVTSCGQKTPLIFIDQGVKINQHVYLEMIKNKVLPRVDETFGNTGVTFQQDGAISHTAKLVQDFKNFWAKDLWPPSSPDLNLMDFGIWSILEQNACTKSHKNVDMLKRKLVKCWKQIDTKTIHAICSKVPSRLHSVIQNKGGYFE